MESSSAWDMSALDLALPVLHDSGAFAYTIAGNVKENKGGSLEQIYHPQSVCCDKMGNIFFSAVDLNMNSIHSISKIAPDGKVSTLAGCKAGCRDGNSAEAQFYFPCGLCIDEEGTLYVADAGTRKIRTVSPDGLTSTFAIIPGRTGYKPPMDICFDRQGNLIVVDTYSAKIMRITAEKVVSTIAGSDNGYQDGSTADAKFTHPSGVCVDSQENIIVVDSQNNKIRKISPEGTVSTIAGSIFGAQDGSVTEAKFGCPAGICIDKNDNMYVINSGNNTIRKITPAGIVSTVRGRDTDNEWGDIQLNNPSGICCTRYGNLVVADCGNKRIRSLVFSKVTEFVIFCLKNMTTATLPSDIILHIAKLHFSKYI